MKKIVIAMVLLAVVFGTACFAVDPKMDTEMTVSAPSGEEWYDEEARVGWSAEIGYFRLYGHSYTFDGKPQDNGIFPDNCAFYVTGYTEEQILEILTETKGL